MVLETLHLLLPCSLSSLALKSSTAKISDTVFFTWYVHLCLPKPLETILKSAFHYLTKRPPQLKNLSKISIIPSLLPSFFSTALCFSSLHAHTQLNFLFVPSSAAIVLYQLQLTTSQVGLRDILDHGGAASSLSASSLLPDSSPRSRWGLVPGRAERHLAKPQKHFQLQTAWCSPRRESRPKVEELTENYFTTIDISQNFMLFILNTVPSICSSVEVQ